METADDVRAMMRDAEAIAAQTLRDAGGTMSAESGADDQSTRPGGFLRALDHDTGTPGEWKATRRQHFRPRVQRRTRQRDDLDT